MTEKAKTVTLIEALVHGKASHESKLYRINVRQEAETRRFESAMYCQEEDIFDWVDASPDVLDGWPQDGWILRE